MKYIYAVLLISVCAFGVFKVYTKPRPPNTEKPRYCLYSGVVDFCSDSKRNEMIKIKSDYCKKIGGVEDSNGDYFSYCTVPQDMTVYGVFIDNGVASSTISEAKTEYYVCLERYKNTTLNQLPVKCLKYYK